MTGCLTRRLLLTASAMALSASAALAGPEEARRWIDSEFQPSTLSKEEQMKEMEWFINAAKPFQNLEINVVSETITTHEYEARTPPQSIRYPVRTSCTLDPSSRTPRRNEL